MNSFVLDFRDIDKTKLALVGGKGANLGELCKVDGILVPEGFCVTTEAYQSMIEHNEQVNELLEVLSNLTIEDREKVGEISGKLRKRIEETVIPKEMEEEIARHLSMLGEYYAYAVRSSATAEDLPTASFAGQQDTYLNIVGKDAVLKHVSKCFASLFTERAIIYRLQNGFDHRKVHLSVVVQKMVFPQAAGIMFTADPVTSNRKVVSIDASFGLGEAMVSGIVNADNYKVRNDMLIDRKISTKKLLITALKDGGTEEQELPPEQQNRQVLTEEQVLRLSRLGRTIEEHFGCPQDIEWCLVGDTVYIVQSRPITTLYPVPMASDGENHVYLSVGHQQMMTDPLKPLGLSIYQLISFGHRFEAGGRLFVDATPLLATPDRGKTFIDAMGQHDLLIKDALSTIVERGDFIKSLPADTKDQSSGNKSVLTEDTEDQIDIDPTIVTDLIQRTQTSIEELKLNIQTKSGSDLFFFILEDIKELKRLLFDPQSTAVFMAAINATTWINKKMNDWLGEKNAADALTGSVPNNITSEMGLELLDVADVVRPYPEIIHYLEQAADDGFLDALVEFKGGEDAKDAIMSYLNKYGMRCVGEIDITKPRFREKPTMLLPMILSNIKNFEPKESKRRFEQGQQVAFAKEQELLDRLKQLPEGELKAKETKRKIDIVRNFIGYREYPKYGMVNRFFVYKQALRKEAEQLIQEGVFRDIEDSYYLTFEEFHEVVRTKQCDYRIVSNRKEEFKVYEKLTPPRVITSEGEVITGHYKRDNLPAEAIAGLPVSSGSFEGRARVIMNLEDADLEDGDILVTSFTDPSWTPLFVSVKGLVTEVGGLMTHGAVIAREYGLPAVVGVENATKLIKDGQRIRVNGTDGYVEILS